MEKRIALLKNSIVFNIVVGSSAEKMATLFNCDAIEVTDETLPANIGYGFANGVFSQPPPAPDPVNEEIVEETPAEEIVEETPVEEEN